jgi:two-component system CheB/CheR fusion protein
MMKLRSHIILIAAVTLLPILIVVCLGVVLLFQKMRDDRLQSLIGTARALSLALDRSFEKGIGTLNALSTSRHLETGNFREFYLESRRVLAAYPGADAIVLVDPLGQQIVNTRVPFGAPLPRGRGTIAVRVAQSGSPTVSNLLTGAVVQRPLLVIGVPVAVAGVVKYVLTLALSSAFLQKLLELQNLSPDYLCTVIDSNRVIAARTRDIDEHLGRPASASLSKNSMASLEGVWMGEPWQFEPVYAAHRRSEFSGWTVALGIPVSKVHRPLWLLLASIVAGIMFFVLLAAALATLLGRRLVSSVIALADGAKELGAGLIPHLPISSVTELDEVGRELQGAATKRANMETALRHSEERLRTIFETEPECVKVVAPDGNVLEINAAGLQMLEADSLDQVRKKSILDFVAPECREGFQQLSQRVLEGSSGKLELEIIGFKGRRCWMETHAAPLRDTSGKVYAVLALTRDISERKRAENALRASEERLKLALSASRMGVWEWDIKNGGVLWSPECYDIVGREISGGTLESFTNLLQPEDARIFTQLTEHALATKTVFSVELRIVGSDDAQRWISNVGRAEYDGEGKPLRMIGTVQDVTERKRLLAEVQEHAAQLADTDRRKDEFLALLAHELRNPLAPVTNAVEILRMSGLSSPQARGATEMIDEQMRHMTRLIDDLLDVSRVTRGTLELRKEQIELSQVMKNAVDKTRSFIDESGVQLIVALPAQPIRLNADSFRLTQVLYNLLHNAAKYTECGGSITLSAQRQGNEVVVSVKDSGIGMPVDKLQHIFEVFAQLDTALERTRGGLGLGLTLVKRLVELHGGTVVAKSEGLEKGSEFIVRLPILPDESAGESSMKPSAGAAAQISRALRVLVVDDNHAAADMLGTLFRLKGMPAQLAHDGEQAVRVAEEFLPDVVLLDLGLPKLNGYDACRRMREQPGGQKIIIIALTGWGRDEDRQRTSEAGFDYHLVKPVRPLALLNLISELAEKKFS